MIMYVYIYICMCVYIQKWPKLDDELADFFTEIAKN